MFFRDRNGNANGCSWGLIGVLFVLLAVVAAVIAAIVAALCWIGPRTAVALCLLAPVIYSALNRDRPDWLMRTALAGFWSELLAALLWWGNYWGPPNVFS